MNLILLHLADFVAREMDADRVVRGIVELTDARRVEHILEVSCRRDLVLVLVGLLGVCMQINSFLLSI
jgi:hypothetical protein